jgi:hypothetical protein
VNAAAESIGIDWYGGGNNGGTTQSQMGSTEWAGVVRQQNWNSFTGSSETTGRTLVDDRGAASGATVTWSSNGYWDTNIPDQGGDRRMMLGYLSSAGTTTVTVSGLPQDYSDSGYDVFVYSDGDNNTDRRAGRFSIGAISATNTDAPSSTFGGTYREGSNYVQLRALTGTSFTLTAIPLTGPTTGLPRAPLNGIQIVKIGEPGNQVIWMGHHSSCALGDYPLAGSFHNAAFWRNFIPPNSSHEAVFSEGWHGPGPVPLYWHLGNTRLFPRSLFLGDFNDRVRGTCLADSTTGGPATLASLLFRGGSWDFSFKSQTGSPDTARLYVAGLTRVGTPTSGASLTLRAGTMTSGAVIVTGPVNSGSRRPSSFLRIANDAILVSPSVTVAQGGELSGKARVRGKLHVSGGRIAPGASPGTLTVEGDLYVNDESELELEVGGLTAGESYDQVIVEGETVLSGTVRISFINGFAPQAGDSFTFFGPTGFDASAATIVTDPGVTIAEFGAPGSQTLQVVAIPTPPAEYQLWRQAKFGSTTSREGEPPANLDGDESQNFTEFLFNRDPNAADEHPLEAGAGNSGLPVVLVVESAGVKRAAFEFIRHKRFGPYVVESSPDLETWTPETPAVDSVVSISNDYERVRVLDVPLPQEGVPNRRFLRISVAR